MILKDRIRSRERKRRRTSLFPTFCARSTFYPRFQTGVVVVTDRILNGPNEFLRTLISLRESKITSLVFLWRLHCPMETNRICFWWKDFGLILWTLVVFACVSAKYTRERRRWERERDREMGSGSQLGVDGGGREREEDCDRLPNRFFSLKSDALISFSSKNFGQLILIFREGER